MTQKPDSPGFIGRYLALKGSPRELWIIFALQILSYVAYKLMNLTWVLWLSYDLGYSDASALFWVVCWSATMTFCTVLIGSFTDAVGIRKALLLGVWICIFSRAVLTFAPGHWLPLLGGMIPLALGESLGTPAMVAAVRRFTTTAQRSIAFSIFYASINVGILVAGYIFDAVRHHLGDRTGHFDLPLLGIHLTTYRTLFLLSLLAECLLLPLLYWMRNGVEATDAGVIIAPPARRDDRHAAARGFLPPLFAAMRNTLRETVRIFAGLWCQPGFYKFLAFLSLAAFVRLIFIQMDYTYPKFGIRELGSGAPVAHLYNINCILIIVLVPIVGGLTHRISAYRMITVGSAVTATSVFIMALPPAWFQSLADTALTRWLAHGYLGLTGDINPWYVMIFLFVVVMSVGEAMFSPRVYEYATAIAPQGQEASYMALSSLPFFLAKIGVATFSGVLLARYCPETGPRQSGTLWLIIALTTAVAPIGLITLRRWIRVPEAGRDDQP